LDNKEEIAYRRAKEKKSMKKHKRMTEYLKNTVNQKDSRLNQETVSTPVRVPASASPGQRSSQSLHLKINQATATAHWQT
jgi:hypothetical protein